MRASRDGGAAPGRPGVGISAGWNGNRSLMAASYAEQAVVARSISV
jgi:hypothetical protein